MKNRASIHFFLSVVICLAAISREKIVLPQSTHQKRTLPGENVVIERYSIEEGLSSRNVNIIYQDKLGFMWIGTENGLNKFDGEQFTVYVHKPGDSSSLSDNRVISILEDSRGRLWVGTSHGLNLFDRKTGTFRCYYHDPKDSSSISNNIVRCLYEGRNGDVWVGTASGLNSYLEDHKAWVRISLPTAIPSHDGESSIGSITEDFEGKLWLGLGYLEMSGGGLVRWDRIRGTFTHFRHDENNPRSLPNEWVTSIYEDRSGELWIATNGGACTFNQRDESFSRFSFPFTEPASVHRMFLKTISEDENGNLWFATWGLGVLRYDRNSRLLTKYTYDITNPSGINSSNVMSLFRDRYGLLWVGTWGGGVNTISVRPFVHHSALGKANVLGSGVSALLKTLNGDLYVGTFMNGVWRVDSKTGSVTHVPLPVVHSPSVMNITSAEASPSERSNARDIRGFLEDQSGKIWIFDGINGEIIVYIPSSEEVSTVFLTPVLPINQRYSIIDFSLSNDGTVWMCTASTLYHLNNSGRVITTFSTGKGDSLLFDKGQFTHVLSDHDGVLRAGLTTGLFQLDKKSGSFTPIRDLPCDTTNLNNNTIYSLYEDRAGRVWVLNDIGLYQFDQPSGAFINYPITRKKGQSLMRAFQPDSKGNLWFATDAGMTKLDVRTKEVTEFDRSDGLPTLEFLGSSTQDLKSGEIFFGTQTGILSFYPQQVRREGGPPNVVLTGFKKFNQSVSPTLPPELLQNVRLTYRENVFSFSFSALSYNEYKYNKYAYLMEGFDPVWINCGTRREAIYTNLDPGTYTFHVKGSNHDGVWNEQGAILSVIVLSPWWKMWWAYTLYAFGAIGIIYGAYRTRINRLLLEQKLTVEHLQAEKLAEINSMKSRFLANVSHELRTPLTLMIGPLQNAITSMTDKPIHDQLQLAQRNAQKLLSSINQLLNFSRLESGIVKLRVGPGDYVAFVRRVVLSFESWAERKRIFLTFKSQEEAIEGHFDREKLEAILNNLISNAVKYTPEQGRVVVVTRKENGSIIISVHDTGEGISVDHLPHIFERFYRADESHRVEGTGIGLAVCKDLVELHHGTISVESTPRVGSTLTVTLPLTGYTTDETTEEGAPEADSPVPNERAPRPLEIPPPLTEEEEATTVLVVEDNDDLREFLHLQLIAEYTILEARNGAEGVDLARQRIPDLVISDVMMPVMNGYELSKELKEDERTCHIPIILLTALAGRESKLEGLNIGADDYLVKPFDSAELHARVRNLIEGRRKLREAFGKTIMLKQDVVMVESLDNAFVRKSMSAVLEHIADVNFGTEEFAHELFLSRTQLHRKLKAITNLSANDFIRHMRLDKAKELLKQNAGTIAEIAERVGFTNHSYFAKSFKEQFGILPSEVSKAL